MKRRIALVYAPIDDHYYTDGVNDSIPLGLLSLDNYAVNVCGLDVAIDIFDGEYYTVSEICDRLPAYDMVCIQSMMASYSNTLELLRAAKKTGALTVLGGHHATQLKREIIRNRADVLDCIIAGDGERAFVDLIAEKPFNAIPNLVYMDDGAVKTNPVERFPIDDNLLLSIDPRHLEQYRRAPVRDTRLERVEPLTSFRAYSHKGCSNRTNSQYCFFCGRADLGVRFKTPANYIRELEYLAGIPSVQYVFEIGDDFLQDLDWLEQVAHLYQKRLGASDLDLKIFARANRVIPDVMPFLKMMNITEVAIGFESGSDSILANITKNSTTADNMQAAHLLFSSGIDTVVSYVLGLPGETDATLQQTLDQASVIKSLAIEHLGRPPQEIIANIIEVNPGAPAFSALKKAMPAKYTGADELDVRETQDDYFKVFFDLHNEQEVSAFRRTLTSYGSRINALGNYSYRAGWTMEDVANAQ